MNSEYVREALDKIPNPHVLVNVVSRRVRQLNGGGGGPSKPLIADAGESGFADVALLEVIHGKVQWEPIERPSAGELPEGGPRDELRLTRTSESDST